MKYRQVVKGNFALVSSILSEEDRRWYVHHLLLTGSSFICQVRMSTTRETTNYPTGTVRRPGLCIQPDVQQPDHLSAIGLVRSGCRTRGIGILRVRMRFGPLSVQLPNGLIRLTDGTCRQTVEENRKIRVVYWIGHEIIVEPGSCFHVHLGTDNFCPQMYIYQ
jgi:hypothetical protein